MVNIQLEWTPNPSTLKYVVDQSLIPRGAINFTKREDAQTQSPLASRLFDIRGVQAVMVGTNFVTVTKGDEGEWDELNDGVMGALETHLGAQQTVVHPEVLAQREAGVSSGGSSIEDKIREILDAEIRPAVAADGGDITLDKFEDGIAYLHMQGSCAGCPSSTATLKMGIETRLKESFPEITEVVAV